MLGHDESTDRPVTSWSLFRPLSTDELWKTFMVKTDRMRDYFVEIFIREDLADIFDFSVEKVCRSNELRQNYQRNNLMVSLFNLFDAIENSNKSFLDFFEEKPEFFGVYFDNNHYKIDVEKLNLFFGQNDLEQIQIEKRLKLVSTYIAAFNGFSDFAAGVKTQLNKPTEECFLSEEQLKRCSQKCDDFIHELLSENVLQCIRFLQRMIISCGGEHIQSEEDGLKLSILTETTVDFIKNALFLSNKEKEHLLSYSDFKEFNLLLSAIPEEEDKYSDSSEMTLNERDCMTPSPTLHLVDNFSSPSSSGSEEKSPHKSSCSSEEGQGERDSPLNSSMDSIKSKFSPKQENKKVPAFTAQDLVRCDEIIQERKFGQSPSGNSSSTRTAASSRRRKPSLSLFGLAPAENPLFNLTTSDITSREKLQAQVNKSESELLKTCQQLSNYLEMYNNQSLSRPKNIKFIVYHIIELVLQMQDLAKPDYAAERERQKFAASKRKAKEYSSHETACRLSQTIETAQLDACQEAMKELLEHYLFNEDDVSTQLRETLVAFFQEGNFIQAYVDYVTSFSLYPFGNLKDFYQKTDAEIQDFVNEGQIFDAKQHCFETESVVNEWKDMLCGQFKGTKPGKYTEEDCQDTIANYGDQIITFFMTARNIGTCDQDSVYIRASGYYLASFQNWIFQIFDEHNIKVNTQPNKQQEISSIKTDIRNVVSALDFQVFLCGLFNPEDEKQRSVVSKMYIEMLKVAKKEAQENDERLKLKFKNQPSDMRRSISSQFTPRGGEETSDNVSLLSPKPPGRKGYHRHQRSASSSCFSDFSDVTSTTETPRSFVDSPRVTDSPRINNP